MLSRSTTAATTVPSQPRRRGREAGAWALLCVWLSLPLVTLAHAAHAHRYCAEHDTIEEAGARSVGAGLEAESFSGAITGAEPTPGTADGSTHQECTVLAAQDRHGACAPPSAALVVAASFTEPAPPSSSEGRPQIPLLTAAPKASPPRA